MGNPPRAVELSLEQEDIDAEQCEMCTRPAVVGCSSCATLLTCEEHAEEGQTCIECEDDDADADEDDDVDEDDSDDDDTEDL